MASKNLLSVSTDAKTVKGEKIGVLTGVLYLAPADVSGREVCAKRSKGCTDACLYTAGRGAFTNVQQARIAKTNWFFDDRESFMATLAKNITSIATKATKLGMVPAIRLNGTSDLPWEKMSVTINGVKHRNLMVAFPEIQFYDYSKVLGRKDAIALPNYHLTFSLAEDNDADAFMAIEQGYNMAVVMRLKPKEAKPTMWMGYPVIDGDENDVRFYDKPKHIVALAAKGAARKDTSGFVRDPNIIARAA
jgi:hypothetical protein